MKYHDFEQSVRECYSTWGDNYYDDFYGPGASYPPVHSDLLKDLLKRAKAKALLDAGCGPASFLRELSKTKMELYGFDLTLEMINEGKRVFTKLGLPPEHLWEGSVLNRRDYRVPGEKKQRLFDAAVCVGVFPHIRAEDDVTVIRNLRGAVKRGGLVAIEARNQFFALFSMNRYTHEFFTEELIRSGDLLRKGRGEKKALQGVLAGLARHWRAGVPPIRRGKKNEPGYDEVLSRAHNPLVLRQQLEQNGFKNVRMLFYHYHCLPPMYGVKVPRLFRRESLAMEKNPEDWRGHFMASAFIVVGKKV